MINKGDDIIVKSKNWVNKYGKLDNNEIYLNMSKIIGYGIPIDKNLYNTIGTVLLADLNELGNITKFNNTKIIISGILLNKVDKNLSSLIECYCNSFCNKNSCDTDCPLNNFYESIDYRVGDKVQIISINAVREYFIRIDDNYFLELGVNLSGNNIISKIIMIPNMLKFCGKEVTISGIIKDPRQQEDDLYLIEEDGEENRWSDIMFKKLYEKTAIIRYCNQCIKCCDSSCPFSNIFLISV